jgi:HSP20 family protein
MSLSIFDTFFGEPMRGRHAMVPRQSWAPHSNADSFAQDGFGSLAVDTDEAGNHLVEIDCPGLGKEDVKVTFEAGVLSISGRKTVVESSSGAAEGSSEEPATKWTSRSTRQFSRSLRLPEGADPSSVVAKVENGIVRITIPNKAREDAPMQIAVE